MRRLGRALRRRYGRSMTPVELRHAFHDTIDAYKRSWPHTHTRRANARHVMNAIKAHPWLMDQIPWDIFDLAKKDAQ
jgi:hypothetical protein